MNPGRLQNIVFASDDQERRRVGSLALRAAGAFTVVTCDLAEALCYCEMQVVPDLILLDVDQDERPALATLGKIVQRETDAPVPVMLLAATTGLEQRTRYCARGAIGVISKPYVPMALASQVEHLWRHAAAVHQVTRQPGMPPPVLIDCAALRVLIVEDEPLQRALLAAALRHAGVHYLEQAGNGAHALEILRTASTRFDVVITDVRMEGMDGIEFLRAARTYQVRAFALSSALDPVLLASTEAVVRANGIALLGVLPKPVQPAKVKALLSACAALEALPEAASLPDLTSSWGPEVLQEALGLGQFVPFFQPKFDLATSRLDGVEVLARWLHPVHGLLPPSEFIDTMEEHGLIDQLTDAIFTQALACVRNWDARGCRVDLAVNLSTRTLGNLELPNRLRDMVAAYAIAPGRITFEMTETAVSAHPNMVLESVTRLRVLGFKVSIDDFGLGYSSLAQLSAMPFTELKIDRSFVAGMPAAGKTLAILESTLALAATLGLRTVAEGIETTAERDYLYSLGCVAGQGYWFARPMAASELLAWYLRQQVTPLATPSAAMARALQ